MLINFAQTSRQLFFLLQKVYKINLLFCLQNLFVSILPLLPVLKAQLIFQDEILPRQLFSKISCHIEPSLKVISSWDLKAFMSIYATKDRRTYHFFIGFKGNMLLAFFLQVLFAEP